MISRLCDEFSCLPSEAARELDEDPERLVLRVLPLRGFANAYEWKSKPAKDRPEGIEAMVEKVIEIEAEDYRAALAEKEK